MDLGNPVEVVVHCFLIGGMVCLGRWDEFPMVSALVYIVTHWTRPMVNHDIRLLDCHDSLSYYVTWTLNLERLGFCWNQ